jgi:2-polyprenyl-3-methyl-5-hydroxy-6-metoxy-1,4-benzoquinol methylase
MSVETTCIVCGGTEAVAMFSKQSKNGESFTLVRCRGCGLRYLFPRPAESDIMRYYGKNYFTERTDRGYNNYFSTEIRREIERVFALNLSDLGFHEFERGLCGPRRSLDIGCAAGYFVNFLRTRGWDSQGIDVSEDCVRFAVDSLGLPVRRGDYLRETFSEKFHLISMWATIEHLHGPGLFLEKAHRELEDGGMLYISTCRAGGANFMRLFGSRWRYYNFPEHLYFFTAPALVRLLRQKGFEVTRYRTYGSGFGKPGSLLRKIADFSAKHFYLGDMMLISARKIRV